MDISMDPRLSCVHIATKFSRNTAVPERPFPHPAFFRETVKINKSKKLKHICIEI